MLATTAGLLLLSAATMTSGGDPREVKLTSGGDPGEVAVFRPPLDELDRLLDVSLLDDIEAQLERDSHTGGNSTALLSRSRRALAFPTGSYAQVDFQLYMPFYTQGDFSAILDWTTRFRLFLPNSTSGISLGRRSLDEDREKIYGIIEAMMYSFGVDGHICLLRTICDVAEQPFQDDGVLGDVLNTVMAASYRWQDDKMYEYVEAEYYGRYYGNCQEAYDCPVSMSRIVDVMTDVVG